METDILYIGDPWLSNSSLNAVAVFTDSDSKAAYLNDLLEKNVISEYGYKCLSGEYGNGRQAEIKGGKLLLTSIPLNPTTSEL